MKRQVRRNVFETNSSSMHSLSIAKRGVTEYLHVDECTNKVVTEFGEFGWGYDEYNDPETKLSYLVTMIGESHNCYSIEEIYETKDNSIVAGIKVMKNQGHSGMSWGLMKSMIKTFCDCGNEFVEALDNI